MPLGRHFTQVADYKDTLRAAIEKAGTSRRQLSFALADHTGNKRESEYRALGKYLAGDELPSDERAAVLAVQLRDPNLALVERERRDGLAVRQQQLDRRLTELEDKVEERAQSVDVFAQEVAARLADLEAAQAAETRPSALQESEPRG